MNLKNQSNASFFLKKKYLRYTVALLTLTCILLFSYYLKNNNYSNLDQKHSGNANNDFQTYAQNLFDEQLLSDSLSMHFYIKTPDKNIRISPVTLGDFSYDSMVKSQQYYINQINLLKDFNYKKLSQKEQLTYDVLLDYFRNQLDYGDLCLCNPVLSPTTGIQAQLPILFAEYTFADKKDIDNYLTLVSQINDFFNQICEFQILKAKNNSFLGYETCNLVIKQCISFLAGNKPKDNLFHTSFVSKISNCKFLSDSEKNNYINKNLDLINSSVFPGYNKIISSLKDLQKSGYCKNNKGICHLKNGKSYYEFLVKNYTGSSKSVLELKSDIQSRLMKDMRTMYSILTVNPELENMFYSEEHNSKSPQAILKELNSKYTDDFPNIGNINYTVKYVDENLQDYLSPAFFLTPAIDDTNNNVIYINESDAFSKQDIYTTLAHEGIPGHMYQSAFFLQTNPLPVRHILSYGGYTEGWATYVEFLSYSYEYSDQRLAKALSCSASYSLALYSLCDIGINYEGWSFKETKDFLKNYNITGDDICKNIYQTVINEPANYLQYYVGYLEITALKEKVQKQLGTDFNLKDFHKSFLTIGPADFKTVEKWIYTFY